MAADGLRVLCLAMRRWDALPEELSAEQVEVDLTILGLAGMMDPPREEAREAVALCKTAGIIPVMITGDHPITANTIAEEPRHHPGRLEIDHHRAGARGSRA